MRTTHSPVDLAFVADALLGICHPDASAPFATEEVWAKREARRNLREVRLGFGAAIDLAAKVQDTLLAEQVREVVDDAGLTQAQSEAFHLRMLGHTFEEIGVARSTSKQAAMNAFAKAIGKLAGSLERYPWFGLDEAYAAETIRHGHRRSR